jgi:hypothetical protein
MKSNSLSNEMNESINEISNLKEGIKSKKILSESKNKKSILEHSSLLFKNDANILKPKFFGNIKTLLYFGKKPIFVLGKGSNKLLIIIIN